MSAPFGRALLAAAALVVLAACRLDVVVEVTMQPDGTGQVIVEAVADAELVGKVPDLVGDLRLDDAVANGWTVQGPTTAADGSVAIRLAHAFATDADLAAILNSIGPPLTNMQAARTSDAEAAGGDTPSGQTPSGATPGEPGRVVNAIDGTLVLPNGFQSFADTELVEAVGGQPFGDDLAASGLSPAEAMSFTLRVALPGELVSSTGTETGDGVIEWQAALDGTALSLRTESVQEPASAGNGWARPLSTISLGLLVAWVVAAGAFLAFVAYARRSKRRRRENALRGLRR